MSIEKKFKMFSTREWIQFLQYKLSPEREKELEAQMSKDAFIKEALITIGDKENRPLAHQSITLLINEVEQYTGVSESKILKSKETFEDQPAIPINWKLIGLIVGGLFVLSLLGYGIFYFLSSNPSADNQEQTMVEAESVSNIQSYADSSSMPMEIIPKASSAASIPVDSLKPNSQKSVIKKGAGQGTTNASNSTQINPTLTNPSNMASPSATVSQKERDLFNQAQEIYKQGNREEAKKILKELKSYDNPMKSQAETILKNMEN